MNNASKTKLCTKCQVEKPLSDFHRDSASKDGHAGACRECWSQYDKARGQTLHRKSQLALKDAKRSRRQVEQETGRTIEDTLTFLDVYWTLSEHECAYCGQEVPKMERTLDHVTSMRYGGKNTFDNVCMACKSCNSAKSDMPAITYMLQSCDSYESIALIDCIASRGDKTIEETFINLIEYAKEYYAVQAERATEKAKEREMVS